MSSDFQNYVNESLDILDNQTIRIGLYIFLAIYILFVIPTLTPDVSYVFNNPFFQIFAIGLIIYIGVKDIFLAILLLIAYILSLHADIKNMIIFSLDTMKGKKDEVDSEIFLPPASSIGSRNSTIIEVNRPQQPQQVVQPIQQLQMEPMGYNDSFYNNTTML
jgi:hypothetical protein